MSEKTPPIISSPLPSGAQRCLEAEWPNTTVSISIVTDEASTCKYNTTDVVYDSMSGTFSVTGTTAHSQSLTLLCGGSFTYYTRCMDGSSNKNLSSTSVIFWLDKDPAPLRVYDIH